MAAGDKDRGTTRIPLIRPNAAYVTLCLQAVASLERTVERGGWGERRDVIAPVEGERARARGRGRGGGREGGAEKERERKREGWGRVEGHQHT
jgi:hypothetical protein